MRTTILNDELTQLNRLRFVNAYLVRESDGFTLIDTTMPGGADALIDAAKSAGGKIRRIALTHGHGDHAGSLDALRQRLGDSVQVFLPELDAPILARAAGIDGTPPGGWPKIATVPDRYITAGDRIGSLEVIATPGHTPGHVAFLDTRTRALIAGDTFTTVGNIAVSSRTYWRFPLAAGATWDKAKNLESAQVLRALDPAILAVGHGPAVRQPGTRMERAIARIDNLAQADSTSPTTSRRQSHDDTLPNPAPTATPARSITQPEDSRRLLNDRWRP